MKAQRMLVTRNPKNKERKYFEITYQIRKAKVRKQINP
jgi:hypothetical protein